MRGIVTQINAHRSCSVKLRNDILVVFAEPKGSSLQIGDELELQGNILGGACSIKNVSQANTFSVQIERRNLHDLRLPMDHGSSRTPSEERLSEGW